MKKRKSNKKSSKKFIYIFFALVFATGVTFMTLSLFMPKKVKNEDNEPVDTVVDGTERKEEKTVEKKITEKEKTKEETDTNPEKTPKQNEATPKKAANKIDADIAINDVSDGTYTLQISIYDLINTGSCKLHMESANGDMIDRTAKIVTIGPDSSSCDGFEIPTSEINPGKYNFTVTMTSGNKTGSVKGEIAI
jgi:hypothetical protein